MSVNFNDSFQENYKLVNDLGDSGDLQALREYRELLYEKEGELTCTRVVSNVKERALLNLQISDIHNLMALTARRINELTCEERYYNPDI